MGGSGVGEGVGEGGRGGRWGKGGGGRWGKGGGGRWGRSAFFCLSKSFFCCPERAPMLLLGLERATRVHDWPNTRGYVPRRQLRK